VADFPLVQGPRNITSTFWAATERDLVIYESRLELALLLFAAFDVSVYHVLA
jgi:hypothetical protein